MHVQFSTWESVWSHTSPGVLLHATELILVIAVVLPGQTQAGLFPCLLPAAHLAHKLSTSCMAPLCIP